jgi:hypothetical protein
MSVPLGVYIYMYKCMDVSFSGVCFSALYIDRVLISGEGKAVCHCAAEVISIIYISHSTIELLASGVLCLLGVYGSTGANYEARITRCRQLND